MEEFEHMIVEEFNEEEFYETIEAPKFVDLTAPDHRPEGDDRFWFCSRVGCDQKHEEFLDSEVIYKNFVLRVMAARSPSVRMRKALYGKDFSVDPKCPNTVPAKPSRSRVSKLAMISSIPQKGNGNNRLKEVKLISKTAPKAKVSSVPQKALTERKNQMQSPVAFMSVQNPRNGTIKVSENKVVAKALVFQSPKKVVKLKRSVELRSSVKKLCNGMRKLETESKRKGLGVNHKIVSSVPSKRPLKTREVKSRVFDSVRSQKHTDEKNKGSSTLKKRVMKKEEPEPVLSSDSSKAHEANGMVLEVQSLPSTGKASEDGELMVENKSEEKGVSTLKKRVKKKEEPEPVLFSDSSKAHEANGMVLENQSLPITEKASEDGELMAENKSEEKGASTMKKRVKKKEEPEPVLFSDSSKAHEANNMVVENQFLPSTEKTSEDEEVMVENKSEEKGASTMKKRVKKKEEPEPVLSSDSSKAHEANNMVVENQFLPSTEKTSEDEEVMVENKSEEFSDPLKANNMNNQLQAIEDPTKESASKQYQIAEIEETEIKLDLECEDKENTTIAADREDVSVIKISELNKAAKQCETVEIEDKENALPLECGNKENNTNAIDVNREGDDKENSSALDTNRKVDQATYSLLKKKVFGKKETCQTTQKVMTVADKCFNGKIVPAGTRVKYTKPKLTNPKPFRLRTDERQILKEANTEKKPQCTLAKEETVSIMGFNGENLGPKHQPVRLEKNTTSRLKASTRGASKSLVSENMMNSKRVVLSGKKQVASKGIETKTRNGETKEVATIKPSVCFASGEKRPVTVPKGPNFHSIHIPKDCTKRVASLQV